jgi:hypothetical protein
MPGRGFRHTIKHNATGRRISVPNPDGPIYREYPHLAHVDPVEFDEVNALLDAKNSKYRRRFVNGKDPRQRTPRKRTAFPGQHACCWYCGWHFVWGGNGIKHNLMCSNSRHWQCWNTIRFNGPLAASKLVEAITRELYVLAGFDEQFAEMVKSAHQGRAGKQAERWRQLQLDEDGLAREQENFKAAIAKFGPDPLLEAGLLSLRERKRKLNVERRSLELLSQRELVLPASVDELRRMLEEKFQKLTVASFEFGDLMRELVPEFHVHLVRLLDGGHLLPRAKVKLALGGIVPDVQHVPDLDKLLTRELTLDLFVPPQRELIREEAVRLAATGLKQREIGKRLPGQPPQAVVQRALALDRKMKELGLESPYVLVQEPPDNYTKLRHHKNPRYHFKPLDGYERPPI